MTVRAPTRAALFPGRQAGSLLTRQGPLAGRYPAVAAMVIFALVPYLILSAALQPLTPIIARDLHMSLQAVNLTNGLANAGYGKRRTTGMKEGNERVLHRRSSESRWPRPCVGDPRGRSEALDRGARGPAIEPRKASRGADAVIGSGRQHRRSRYRESPAGPAGSKNPSTRVISSC